MNIDRPGNQTRPIVLALGFGAFLLGTLALVQGNLLRQLSSAANASAANLAFFDVQTDQARAPRQPASVARLSRAVAGADRAHAHCGVPGPQASGSRAQRAAGLERARRGERIAPPGRCAGSIGRAIGIRLPRARRSSRASGGRATGPDADGVFEISLEQSLAEELGVSVGDTITWDVQGVRIRTRITSLRDVEWTRFEPNFFVVFQPAALRDAPQSLRHAHSRER